MKYNRPINHNEDYYLYNRQTGEILRCTQLRPLYNAMRVLYRGCTWTAEHEVETNSIQLVACYNNLMAHS